MRRVILTLDSDKTERWHIIGGPGGGVGEVHRILSPDRYGDLSPDRYGDAFAVSTDRAVNGVSLLRSWDGALCLLS